MLNRPPEHSVVGPQVSLHGILSNVPVNPPKLLTIAHNMIIDILTPELTAATQ